MSDQKRQEAPTPQGDAERAKAAESEGACAHGVPSGEGRIPTLGEHLADRLMSLPDPLALVPCSHPDSYMAGGVGDLLDPPRVRSVCPDCDRGTGLVLGGSRHHPTDGG